MNRRADWLAWSMQFLLGLVVGALGSLAFCDYRVRGMLLRPKLIAQEHSYLFSLGLALFGAALASYFGDRLWLGDSYRIIPPDAPQHNFTSRLISILAGFAGGILMFIALARTFAWLA